MTETPTLAAEAMFPLTATTSPIAMSPRKTIRTRRQLDPAFDSRLGSRLRLRRHQLGLTQEQLAERLGLTFQQVQKYENGRNQITVARLLQICDVLDAPASYFLADESKVATPSKVDFALARTIAAISSPQLKAALLRLAQESRRLSAG